MGLIVLLRSMLDTEADILHKIVAGDTYGFEYLYRNYYSKLCAHAMRYMPTNEDAEEIVQQVITKLWENRAKASSIQNLQAYLYKMVHNACLNAIAKEKVRNNYKTEAELELSEIALEDDSVIDEDLQSALYKAIDELPTQSQNVFKMKHIDGLKYKEIGEALGIGERTVETHLKRAMKTVKEKILAISSLTVTFLLMACNFLEMLVRNF